MRIFFLATLLVAHTYSMDLNTAIQQSNDLQLKLEEQKNTIITGPDYGYHFLSSLVQALIYPVNVTYLPDELYFTHYEHSHILYFESSGKVVREWLPLISESESDLEESARKILKECDSIEQLTEKQKLRIARAWLHQFLTDSSDSPFILKRKQYLDALREDDHETLAKIAPEMSRYTNSLIDEIHRRKKEILP